MANEVLWGLVNTLIRISVLLCTMKLFSFSRPLGICCLILIVLSVLYGVAIVLEIFLICRPLAAAWDSNISGECGQEVVSYVVLEIFGLGIDLAILIAPLRVIWRLLLTTRSKIEVSCVLSAGGLYVSQKPP